MILHFFFLFSSLDVTKQLTRKYSNMRVILIWLNHTTTEWSQLKQLSAMASIEIRDSGFWFHAVFAIICILGSWHDPLPEHAQRLPEIVTQKPIAPSKMPTNSQDGQYAEKIKARQWIWRTGNDLLAFYSDLAYPASQSEVGSVGEFPFPEK